MRRRTRRLRGMLAGMHYSGASRFYEKFENALGMILMFHHIKEEPAKAFAPNAHLTISPEFLLSVIHELRRQDIDIVSIDEAHQRILCGSSEKRFAVFTFDDGYRDNLEIAYPALKEEGVPFTVYVATGLVEGTADMWWWGLEELIRRQNHFIVQMPVEPLDIDCSNTAKKYAAYKLLLDHLSKDVEEIHAQRWVRELCWSYKVDLDEVLKREMMTWQEVTKLAADPLCTIGAHTRDHRVLARLLPNEARDEMRDGAAVLETVLGTSPRHFAYPYGFRAAAGPREFEMARTCGFETAVTTRPGMIYAKHKDNLTALPRISVNGRFQHMRYFRPLLSGLPTKLANRFKKLNVKA